MELTESCPRIRETVDLSRVQASGQIAVCLYDRQDPDGGRVVLREMGLVLASLLDGERTVAGVRAAFMLRTGMPVTERQVTRFVHQLDHANLLDSERYRRAANEAADAFRRDSSRPAAHAGGAYPSDPDELRAFLDSSFFAPGGPGRRPGPPRGESPRAIIAPHIDLHRGRHSYAWAYRELAEREPADLYVLLGTCHVPMTSPFASTRKPYDTPFGPAPTDGAFLDRLAKDLSFDLLADELKHRDEHSIEFQTVYLRYLGLVGEHPKAKVVPILCVPPHDLDSAATPSASPPIAEFLLALRSALAEDGRRICVVAGADFAHVGPKFGDPVRVDARFAEHVRAGDLSMLELIARGDVEGFYRQVVDEIGAPGIAGDGRAVGGARRICGLAPIYALLWVLGGAEGRVVHYDQWIDQEGAGAVTFGGVVFP